MIIGRTADFGSGDIVGEGNSMDRAELISELHEIAASMKSTVAGPAAVDATGGETDPNSTDTSIVDTYGLSSLDVLEYLLILEERFDVVFEDEELTEQTLFSIEGLATYIEQQRASETRSVS